MSNLLYIIIPFFSFGNFELRKSNLVRCLNYLVNFSNIHIVIVNGVYNNNGLENEDFILNKKITYLKYELPSILWVKENLINLAIKSLPTDWQYACWADADIIFLNQDLAKDTIEKLQTYDTAQLYQNIIYLDKNGNIDSNIDVPYHKAIMPSFVYKSIFYKKYTFSPTGFAWAFNRNLYNKIGKFFEYSIIGGGDFLFAVASTASYEFGKSSILLNKMPSENYANELLNYFTSFLDCKTNYIDGTICHLWHGNLNQRSYNSRWNVLLKNKFSPSLHLNKDLNGVVYIKDEYKNLEQEIYSYFLNRND